MLATTRPVFSGHETFRTGHDDQKNMKSLNNYHQNEDGRFF